MVKLHTCARRKPPTHEIPVDRKRLEVLDEHDRMVAKRAMTALATGVSLSFRYDGLPRIVEVHAVGVSTAGKPCMRVYQVQGSSLSGEEQGWKLISIGKVEDPRILDIKSLAPREGYKHGDLGMKEIFTEV